MTTPELDDQLDHGHIIRAYEDDHDGLDDHGHISLSLTSLKIIVLFINLLSASIGLFPAYLPACRRNEKLLSLMNSFAGGIFLGMAIIDVAPEVERKYHAWAIS